MILMPVSRYTLVQSVVDQFVTLITGGALAPGDRLPSERELMVRLGVGRSTIREALRSLAMMNLVDMRPGQGSFVKGFGVQTVIRPDLLTTLLDRGVTVDLLEVRKMIEPATAEMAAHRATEAELAEVWSVLERCRFARKRGNVAAELSAQFHVAIAACTHNGVLAMLMESIVGLLTDRGGKLEQVPGFAEWEMGSHQEIAQALQARDAHLARRLMARHLEESARWLLDSLETAATVPPDKA